jgi:hypothetical protein
MGSGGAAGARPRSVDEALRVARSSQRSTDAQPSLHLCVLSVPARLLRFRIGSAKLTIALIGDERPIRRDLQVAVSRADAEGCRIAEMHRQSSNAGTDWSTDLGASSRSHPEGRDQAEPRLGLCIPLNSQAQPPAPRDESESPRRRSSARPSCFASSPTARSAPAADRRATARQLARPASGSPAHRVTTGGSRNADRPESASG